jgi:hypothetical protein
MVGLWGWLVVRLVDGLVLLDVMTVVMMADLKVEMMVDLMDL